LETTVTYDKTHSCFVVHTPSVEAVKWWPGAMAGAANYVVLFANLIIEEKSYGVHSWLV
jgi:acyl-CoA oxidase